MRRLVLALVAALSLAAHPGAPARAASHGAASLGGGVNLWDTSFCGGQPNLKPAIDYFYGQGVRLFRIPLPWETAQRTLGGPLNEALMTIYDTNIAYALSKPGVRVILDLHNYMRYAPDIAYHAGPFEPPSGYYNGLPCTTGGTNIVVGGTGVPAGSVAQVWTLLAARYPDQRIIYGLMNEPYGADEGVIKSELVGAIAAIRAAGHANVVTVGVEPGGDICNYGACTGTPTNVGDVLATDPAHNAIAEVHSYFDGDGSGSQPTCSVGHAMGNVGLFQGWAHQRGIRYIVGEFGAGANAGCRDEVFAFMAALRADPLALGWTWWAGGQQNGGYIYQLLPTNLGAPVEQMQMGWLRAFMP